MCAQGSQEAVAEREWPIRTAAEATNIRESKEAEKHSWDCEKREKSGQKYFVARAQDFMGWPGGTEVAKKAGSAVSQEEPAQGWNRKDLSQRPKGWRREEAVGSQGWKVGLLDRYTHTWRGMRTRGRLWGGQGVPDSLFKELSHGQSCPGLALLGRAGTHWYAGGFAKAGILKVGLKRKLGGENLDIYVFKGSQWIPARF